MSDISDALKPYRPRGVNGLTGMRRLDAEIAQMDEHLFRYSESSAYDAGGRNVAVEAYLFGLQQARRWMRKARQK